MTTAVISDLNSTRVISEFVSELQFDALPERTVWQAKRSILDTLGCSLYGSVLPWSQLVVGVLERQGSRGDVTVWGTTSRLSAAEAALANGTFAHGFELDDVHQASYMHLGSTTLPATLALAQLQDHAVSGRDLIAAQVAGYEIGARLGMSAGKGFIARGFHPTGIIGALAAAAASSRLLNLDAAATQDAIGMAGSLASGLGGAQYGSSVKRMHAGRAAQAGAYSALLAAEGFRGIRDLFELPHGGFIGTFTADCDVPGLTADLGSTWHTERIGYKMYPACAASHTSIEAAIDLVRDEGVSADDIDSILVTGTTHVVNHVGWEYVPDTVTTAQMNLSFAVASALLEGKCTVDQFSEERLADPTVLALAKRIEAQTDPEADAKGPELRNAITMTARTHDGRELRILRDQVRGNEHRPATDDEVHEKFEDLAGRVVSTERVAELRTVVGSLETRNDIGELLALLSD